MRALDSMPAISRAIPTTPRSGACVCMTMDCKSATRGRSSASRWATLALVFLGASCAGTSPRTDDAEVAVDVAAPSAPEVAPRITVLEAPLHVSRTWFHGSVGDTRELNLRVETSVGPERTLHVVFPAIDGVLIKRLELTFHATEFGTIVEGSAQWATDHITRGRPSGGDIDELCGLVVIPSHEWWTQRSLRGVLLLFGRTSTGDYDQLFGQFRVPSF